MDSKRVQFDFSPNMMKALNLLVENTDATTKAEVIRKALKLYSHAVWRIEDGHELYFEKDGVKTIVAYL